MTNLKAFGNVLLRSPLLPVNRLYNYDLTDEMFREGLYLSSPDLFEQIGMPTSDKEAKKAHLAILKYWNRACFRSTPYGTFAGSCLLDVVDDQSDIVLCQPDKHVKKARLDMSVMLRLTRSLISQSSVFEQLILFPNNSIYRYNDSIRYAEYTVVNGQKNYELVSVRSSSYLEDILRESKNGASCKRLKDLLVSGEGVSEIEASDFIMQLLNSQLLSCHLEGTITGSNPIEALMGQIEKLQGIDDYKENISLIKSILENTNIDVEGYKKVEELIQQLGINEEKDKNLFQTDMFLSTTRHKLDVSIVSSIVDQAGDIMGLARGGGVADLTLFKAKFLAKYDQREVSLATAIDADLGVGYGSSHEVSLDSNSFIDGLHTSQPAASVMQTDHIQQFALRKFIEFQRERTDVIEINADDVVIMKRQREALRFPHSMYIMGSLMKSGSEPLSLGNFAFHIKNFAGPSAGNLFGRFAYGNEELLKLTRDILTMEEDYDEGCIYAEIAHWPQGRTGNVILRPLLRRYEIPYVGLSGADQEYQIPIADLTIKIRNGEVVLFSQRLKRRVIPRLTTAHAYWNQSLPMYKFLCDLQRQNLAMPTIWDWGDLESQEHLPRVTYKNLIVKRARWILHWKDVSHFSSADNLVDEYKAFFLKKHIPFKSIYAESDNELLIDIDKPNGIQLLISYLKKFQQIKLYESLLDVNTTIIRNEKGEDFSNELVIPVYTEKPEVRSMTGEYSFKGATDSGSLIKRKFLPGSEWLTFKVYCGAKSGESILRNILLPFLNDREAGQLFHRMFFVRYKDEFSHLRVRFYNEDIGKQSRLQLKVLEAMTRSAQAGLIDKILIDTYDRELERYGADIIAHVEDLFYNDSCFVLSFISLLDVERPDFYRMIFALRSIDVLLGDFGLSLEQKHGLLKMLSDNHLNEFGGTEKLKKQLNERYKKYQREIFSHMNPAFDTQNEIEEAVHLLRYRSDRNLVTINRIKEDLGEGDFLKRSIVGLPHYIHMSMNRLFIANQRKHELVIYLFLERYYSSQLAITKGRR